MSGRLQREIKQKAPLSLEQELYLNLVRTSEELSGRLATVLKQHDLSHSQYNVLRILRGAGNQGLACGEIGERMVTRDPDVTRLLDRLEKRRLITRARGDRDRRVVTVQITDAGLKLLKQLDLPVEQTVRGMASALGRDRQRQLVELLEELREKQG